MIIRSISLPLLLVAFTSAPVSAFDVYRWVDAKGTVHFSQWEPAGVETPVETVTVEEGSTTGIGGDVYPIEQQAEAMAALWAEIELQRSSRQALRQQSVPAPAPYSDDSPAFWPVWNAGRPPHVRPPFPPHPLPPGNSNPPSLPYRPPGHATGPDREPGN